MGMGISQTSLLRFGNRAAQSITSYGNQIRTGQRDSKAGLSGEGTGLSSSERQNLKARQRQLIESKNAIQGIGADGKKAFQGQSANSILGNSQAYRDALSASRTKSKDTSLKMKKLRYDFKGISSQIMRSKTSTSARQAVSKAKREVARLKRLQNNSDYDQDELQAAISHAKAMERVAKKKVNHLLEEEMGKIGSQCLGSLEEQEEKLEDGQSLEEQERLLSEGENLEQLEGEDLEAMQDMADARYEDLTSPTMSLEALGGSMEDAMAAVMEEMQDTMSEMLEDMGFEDLTEDFMAVAEKDMDPADLKMMKIKHRCKEMKEMAEADGEYLKAIFDQLQKQREGAVSNMVTGTQGASSNMPSFSMEVPAMQVSAFETTGGFDISI